MLTDIYRIKTRNSVYEIWCHKRVDGTYSIKCKKLGTEGYEKTTKATSLEFLEKLAIGPSFDVPGVVLTSRVQDYQHFKLVDEPKVRITGPGEHLLTPVVEAVKEQLNPAAVLVDLARTGDLFEELPDHATRVLLDDPTVDQICGIDGCQVKRVPGLPRHEGSRMCKSGSIASGGSRAHCSCDTCY